MSTIKKEVQKLSMDNLVTLYELDATNIGGSIYHFTKRMRESSTIAFGGTTYIPIDIDAQGFTYDGNGAFPTPTLRVSNVGNLVSAAIIDLKDLIGAKLTRIRTFEAFLDGSPDADSGQTLPVDIFTVEQKTFQNKIYVEWRLSSSIDAMGKKLPGGIVLRDVCPRRYRIYRSATNDFYQFDASKGGCPYAGTKYFDENDVSTTKANDMCSKHLDGCKARFGQHSDLPTYAFPGVSRLST